MQFHAGQHIHIIGIGGFGMSAIARILLQRGFSVSGSDRNTNALSESLAREGATVYHGHAAAQVDGADMVLATSAVPPDHVEIVGAKSRNIPVYKRQDVLAPLMVGQKVIAVAGTHGKTTTTSMLVHILRECGADPSYIVGGVLANTGDNAGVGEGGVFVIEADEYDNMFLGLQPDVAVITNLEWDHPDFFHTEADLIDSFQRFVQITQDNGGHLIIGADVQAILNAPDAQTYDLNAVEHIEHTPEYTQFDFQGRTLRLALPGAHNVLNAVAAILASGQDGDCVMDALATFKTTGRRFDVRGEENGVTIIDDYAHHPTAIKATLAAARARYPDKRLYAVWQPHTYTRTHTLLDQYAVAFDPADVVLVTDIYAAREQPIAGVDGKSTAKAIRHPYVQHIAGLENLTEWLLHQVESPAVVIIMSAGDAIDVGIAYMKRVNHGDTNT